MKKILSNLYLKIVSIVVSAILIYFLIILIFPKLNIFKRNPLELKNTAIIIEGSKKLAQLHGAKYYSELVLDTTKMIKEKKQDLTNTFTNYFSAKKENETYVDSSFFRLTIIGKGTVFAGTDLIEFNEKNISFNDTICYIEIPKSKIISAVINPSDFDIFTDEGKWSPQEVQIQKSVLVEKIKKEAIQSKILEKSDKNIEKMMITFLKSLGFKDVKVKFF